MNYSIINYWFQIFRIPKFQMFEVSKFQISNFQNFESITLWIPKFQKNGTHLSNKNMFGLSKWFGIVSCMFKNVSVINEGHKVRYQNPKSSKNVENNIGIHAQASI